MNKSRIHAVLKIVFSAIFVALLFSTIAHARTSKKNSPAQLRGDYIARLQEEATPKTEALHTVGSLWSPGDVGDLSTDYKARKLNDTVVILVSVQTNPLLNANSNTTLKGSGATDSSTTFQTSMTAQVIAVLPSGNLVIEAQRKIFMNNQHEDIIIRGVVRPNDIGSNNTVPSTALSNLEIEMKGKGIIADSTRRPNRITRALLWLVGF